MRRCRHIIQAGNAALEEEKKPTVSFGHAVESLLAWRQQRRPRTKTEITHICQRMMRHLPWLKQRRMRHFTSAESAALLQLFPTPRQRMKARAVLHGLFSHALRQGWCESNPIATLPKEYLQETEIQPLTPTEIKHLLSTALLPPHRICMPAVGLMLWAGIRPAELARLTWDCINREDRIISIRPQQSKTGGCRHVTLFPVLERWLVRSGFRQQGSVCPPNWLRRWNALRRQAGLLPWRQDVLRHTFASYHAKHFRNFPLLQTEMGHRSAELLRTRYLNMRGITAEQARAFWQRGY